MVAGPAVEGDLDRTYLAPRPFYDVIHIGRSKCASIYLQRTALSAHPEIALFFEEHKGAFHDYWNYEFGYDTNNFLAELRRQPYWNRKPGAHTRVFSHETLTGHMATGNGARLTAHLTVEAFGRIRAFVAVREPYSYVYSVWNQYIQEGGTLTFKQYHGEWISPSWNRTLERSRVWRTALNSDLVQYWQHLLGDDNLLVLCLEDLKSNPTLFLKRLYRFIGVDDSFVPPPSAERARYTLPMLQLKRWLNFWVRTEHNQAGLLPEGLHKAIRRIVGKYGRFSGASKVVLDANYLAPPGVDAAIRADILRLSQLLGGNLAELDYDL